MTTLGIGVQFIGEVRSDIMSGYARQIEEWGFDHLWPADERFFREVYANLTLCALSTHRIRLGPCVTDPYTRHPALTAMAIATLDEVSGGRAFLGIGAGLAGFEAMGFQPTKRAKALREATVLIRRLLSGERVEFHGETVRLNEMALDFKPLRADVPIYIGSNSPLGLRAAGEVADGSITSGMAGEGAVRYVKGLVGQGAAKAGRDAGPLKCIALLKTCVSQDGKGAKDAVRVGVLQSFLNFPAFAAVGGVELPAELRARLDEVGYTHDPEKLAELSPLIPDECVDAFALAGDPDEVAERLVRLAGLGVDEVIVAPFAPPGGDAWTTVETFATKVLPLLRG